MAYGIVNVPGGAGQELETVKNMAQSVNAAIHATNLVLGKTARTVLQLAPTQLLKIIGGWHWAIAQMPVQVPLPHWVHLQKLLEVVVQQ